MRFTLLIGFLILAMLVYVGFARGDEPAPVKTTSPLLLQRQVSDKTQAAIWKLQAKINSLSAQINESALGKQRMAEIEALQKAAQQANAECGEGWHMEQNAKEDLVCAANPAKKE